MGTKKSSNPSVDVKIVEGSPRSLVVVTLTLDSLISSEPDQYVGVGDTFEDAFRSLAEDLHKHASRVYDDIIRMKVRRGEK